MAVLLTAIFYICTKHFPMKKVGLFIALFAIPILAYLFFSTGVNIFRTLPITNENVPELPANWTTADGERIQMKDKITVLGFIGDLTFENKSNMTNVSQEIYQKNKRYMDLQVVYVVPENLKADVDDYLETLSRTTELPSWHYLFATPEEITQYYTQLNLDISLQESNTPYVFIIDKDLRLRSRMEEIERQQSLHGYLTSEPIEILHNEMEDDLKVVLAEYRLATKKNYQTEE